MSRAYFTVQSVSISHFFFLFFLTFLNHERVETEMYRVWLKFLEKRRLESQPRPKICDIPAVMGNPSSLYSFSSSLQFQPVNDPGRKHTDKSAKRLPYYPKHYKTLYNPVDPSPGPITLF